MGPHIGVKKTKRFRRFRESLSWQHAIAAILRPTGLGDVCVSGAFFHSW